MVSSRLPSQIILSKGQIQCPNEPLMFHFLQVAFGEALGEQILVKRPHVPTHSISELAKMMFKANGRQGPFREHKIPQFQAPGLPRPHKIPTDVDANK